MKGPRPVHARLFRRGQHVLRLQRLLRVQRLRPVLRRPAVKHRYASSWFRLPLYRAWCSVPDAATLRPGAAVGLAECGTRADAALLWPLIGHPAAGVRAGGVAGLRLLDAVEAQRLRPLLDDPAPGVVRETTVALLPSVEQLPVRLLRERLGAGWPRHARVAAFRLLQARGGIERLRAAVDLLDDADPKLRGWAEQSVQRWQPSREVRHGDPEVGALLDGSAHLFSPYELRRRKRGAGLRV